MLDCPICSKPRDARYVNERANEACVDPCHWPYLSATEVARASIALDRIHAKRDLQPCRACQTPFPYDPDADYCPACAASNAGEHIVGTYARESDGSTLLFYSPLYFNDGGQALRSRRADFRVLVPGDKAYRPDAESLSPGEWFDTREES